ncbi:MAG: U32 family peptidase, partial [Lachnospiraceae bacterium]|nr:U32 family peptidase [Lachnospiraceae bacterium]
MKDKNENKFELLAPAGSFEIFKAVIAAGADAVYVGGEAFGARAYANNFTDEELLTAIDYAHLRNKKVYLTVNTLLKNSEMDRLYDYLLPFYERGLDAVLVQDLGVLSYIRKHFPDLPVHTSTQMTVTGIEGARLLQSLGAERIVMAREVSLEEMRAIHEETGIELEAFVHGALCYSYSGQCLFSSMLGGRSGNRGRCAQPCRLAYSVLDEKRREYLSDSYVLSLKD